MDQKRTLPAEWRRRRTRHEPPGLDEAIAAAQSLTDQVESQVEIATQLIGLPEEQVRPAVVQAAARARRSTDLSVPARQNATRVVVVERRGPRARLGQGLLKGVDLP